METLTEFGVPANEIRPESTLAGLHLDSLDRVELLERLNIPLANLVPDTTVADLQKLLEEL